MQSSASEADAHPRPRAGRLPALLRSRRTLAACALLAAGALAAGCSSSGKGGTTSDTSSQAAPVNLPPGTPATGSTYTIGNISSVTGSYASSIGGTFDTVDAWVQWTNGHGGINGHKVQVITKDDGGVPANGIAAAKSLMDQHVMAIVGSASNTIASWYQQVTAAGIPVIGGQTNGGELFQTVPLLFPTGETSTVGILDLANKQGKKKIAVMYCSEVPACASQTDNFKTQANAWSGKLGGVQVAYSAAVSGSAPNYTAQCLAARQAGADAMYIADSGSVSARVFKDCASQGFKPLPLGFAPSVDSAWLKEPTLDGAYVTEMNFPWFANSTPPEQAFQAAIRQYHPDLMGKNTFNANTSQVWAALEVYKAAMVKANTGDAPTATDVVNAMYNLGPNWSLDGVTPPLTFTRGQGNPPVDCYFLVQIKGGNYTVANDGKYTCPAQ